MDNSACMKHIMVVWACSHGKPLGVNS